MAEAERLVLLQSEGSILHLESPGHDWELCWAAISDAEGVFKNDGQFI